MRSRRRENMNKEVRIRGNLHLTMDGDRDRNPHWSTGLSPQGPNEKQKIKSYKGKRSSNI